jgi:UDP-3-O-[3-hydroxymyristoyl] glucosamine N-acyltransferase
VRWNESAIDPAATIGARVVVAPGARIGAGAALGDDVVVGCHAVVHPRVTIGARATIGDGAVVGREGFGFADAREGDGVRAVRLRHLAGVRIGDDVEIGALCTIDAGVLTTTTIGDGTKIDAHVHVGHGVAIGARCRIAAQTGFAGSARIGDDVFIGGQVGVGDHVSIGDRARIAGKAGVIGDVDDDAIVAGYPAVARTRWLRGHARLYRR